MTVGKRRRSLAAAAAVLSGVLVLSACNDGDKDGSASGSATPQSQAQVDEAAAQKTSKAQITISPKNGAQNASINNDAKVTVTEGKLTAVTMTSAEGAEVKGEIAADGLSWKPSGPLKRATVYKIAVTAADAAGLEAHENSSFTTVSQANSFIGNFTPEDGSTVGVGMPVSINFNKAITDKKAVQGGITVSSSSGQEVVGHWFNSTRLDFRPQAPERLALHRQLADQRREQRIVRMPARVEPQKTHDLARLLLPVDEQVPAVVAQEEKPRDVALLRRQRGDIAEQRGSHPVAPEDVRAAPHDIGGDPHHRVHQLLHARPQTLRPRRPPPPRRRLRQPGEMLPLRLAQPQRPRDRVEHLHGHVPPVALLEPRVVRHGHSGQLRQLLTAQARHPTVPPELGQAHVLGLQPGPAGAQEFTEFGTEVHTARLSPPDRADGRAILTLPVVGTPVVGRTGGWVRSSHSGTLDA
ncbi:hypothetical protein STANM309S_00162 [Streptomyces tanashiensis]